MPRPRVDVVVPFAGTDEELRRLRGRLERLRLGPQDTLTIVDNRADDGVDGPDGVLRAPELRSSYHARNRGAAAGDAPWIVFVDADLEVSPDLVDRYFDAPPAPATAVLIGEIETTLAQPSAVARYGWLSRHLDTASALKPSWEYAQTANAAVRRDAFDAVGGFVGHVRSGGDADLAFRLRARGHGIERRPRAVVRHPPRATLPALIRQFARYGSGSQWLHERYPRFAPPKPLPRLLVRVAKGAPAALLAALGGDRDRALVAALDPVVQLTSEVGRFLPNQRGGAGIARHAARVVWARLTHDRPPRPRR
jgi:glycosyltransferase involved in cell wall biosynthesis